MTAGTPRILQRQICWKVLTLVHTPTVLRSGTAHRDELSHRSVYLGISHVAVSKGVSEVTRLTHSSPERDLYDGRFTCGTFVKFMDLQPIDKHVYCFGLL